jgi:hypothetical protein
MSIAELLLNMALQSGRLRFEETEAHFKLHARFCGMEILVSSMSKQAIKEQEKQARRAAFSVVS